jgi:hypothetical protein
VFSSFLYLSYNTKREREESIPIFFFFLPYCHDEFSFQVNNNEMNNIRKSDILTLFFKMVVLEVNVIKAANASQRQVTTRQPAQAQYKSHCI